MYYYHLFYFYEIICLKYIFGFDYYFQFNFTNIVFFNVYDVFPTLNFQ
jgi:hypothetical protein